MARRRYWLFKSEPSTYSIDDLAREPGGRAMWDGIRNYQVRNLLRDEVRVGDGVLFHHSGIAEPAVVGTARVVRAAYPDPTQFDPRHPGYDSRSSPDAPRWLAVDIALVETFSRPVTLAAMRAEPRLAGLAVLRRGNRLSVTPVPADAWRLIVRLGRG
ncbi:MAG: EVE domain-containing protein [Acidobacteria bacterium]|nr:MAG: EVE domain-containing protein [Acidobacteriota bacterium]